MTNGLSSFQKTPPTGHQAPWVTGILLATLALAFLGVGAWLGLRAGLTNAQRVLDRRGTLLVESVSRIRDNFRLLPRLLAGCGEIRRLLENPGDSGIRERGNERLDSARTIGEVDITYVLDAQGSVIASSNRNTANSFVGTNYGFRPYFRDAMAGQPAYYTALGAPSGRLGYYLSAPVLSQGRPLGVLAIKVELAPIVHPLVGDRQTKDQPDLLLDQRGIVIGSSLPQWVMRPWKALGPDQKARLRDSRRYGSGPWPEIESTWREFLGVRLYRFADLPGRNFLAAEHRFSDPDWRLVMLADPADFRAPLWRYLAVSTALAALAILAILYLLQRERYRNLLLESAVRDPLTGLFTRRYLQETAPSWLLGHQRSDQAGFAAVLLDLDHFKQVNDTHGHLQGDKVLREVGNVLLETTRGGDIPVRLGGEELLVLVHCSTEAQALAFAERIRARVLELRFGSGEPVWGVTLSGGVARRRRDESLESLLDRADKALYRAKALGRDRIFGADEARSMT